MSDYNNNYNANNTSNELDWDSEIEHDSEFILLPEGEYDFKVVKYEQAVHNGSDKLPRCSKAILTVEVRDAAGRPVTLTHNLFLHRKCEPLLCAFFTAIGQRKHGEKLKMNWLVVPGSTGRCKLGVRNWKTKDGEDRQSNEIKSFLEPKAAPAAPAAHGFTPGTF